MSISAESYISNQQGQWAQGYCRFNPSESPILYASRLLSRDCGLQNSTKRSWRQIPDPCSLIAHQIKEGKLQRCKCCGLHSHTGRGLTLIEPRGFIDTRPMANAIIFYPFLYSHQGEGTSIDTHLSGSDKGAIIMLLFFVASSNSWLKINCHFWYHNNKHCVYHEKKLIPCLQYRKLSYRTPVELSADLARLHCGSSTIDPHRRNWWVRSQGCQTFKLAHHEDHQRSSFLAARIRMTIRRL